MIEDNENDIQRSLMILATLASQDAKGFQCSRVMFTMFGSKGWLVNHHFYPLKITGCPTKSNSISATFGALGGAGRLFGTVQACVVQDPALFGGNFLIAVFVFSLMVAGAMYASIMQRWEAGRCETQLLSRTSFSSSLFYL